MGLETPLALLGLLAAALPWLAHRIRRRDLEPVKLPTFALLRKAEAHKRRSRGLTDLLLLLLRMAIVICAALGLAAPYATARLHFGDGSIASAVIVIDDSLSMMRRDGNDTLLAQAATRARRAIASLPQGSEVSLVTAGRHARVLLRRTTDLALARTTLEALPQSTVRGADLLGALKLAAQQLDSARHTTRRILALSDFAAHTQLRAEDVHFEGIQTSLQRVGSVPPPANVYFTSWSAVPDPSAKGQTSIAIEIAAYGDAPERVPVSVRSAEREIGRAELHIVAGRARATLEVPTPPLDADPTALLHIDVSDAIEADNTAGVLLRPSDAVQVMLVNGDPHPASDRDELHYALRALRLATANDGALVLRVVDASAISKYDLTQVDVVVLANVEAPLGTSAERLQRFVHDGGGLLVTAGDHVQPRAYNAALADLLPCRIRARTTGADIAMTEPEPSKLLPAGPSGLAQTQTHERLALDCESEVPLRFSDGSPALAQADVGRGRSALLATSIDADWSDLPFRPGFLPLLTRVIRGLARAEFVITGPVPAGSNVQLAVPPDAARMEVVAPDGLRQRYDDLKGHTSVEFTHTDSAGPYRVLASSERGALLDTPRGAFVIESPRAESDLTPLANVESWGMQAVRGGAAATMKRSLASYVLLVFAMLVLLEGGLRLRTR